MSMNSSIERATGETSVIVFLAWSNGSLILMLVATAILNAKGRSGMNKVISVLMILFLCVASGVASAADYPTRHITLYVGYAPGGATDTAARIVTNQVNKYLEQPMIVNNKPGAGSAVAADFVAKAKPDGYTLFNATSTTVIQTVATPNNPFKMSEFTPIVGLYSMPLVIVVKADSKLNTIEDFIDFAKKNPNRLNVGTPGINSGHHFSLELFKERLESR